MDSEPTTPKKRSYTKRPLRTAYSITLPFGRSMDVKESANAWWMEQDKVQKLILALGVDSPIKEACDYAGITARQYKYFCRAHPEFQETRIGFEAALTLKARMGMQKAIDNGNYRLAMWYLTKKRPEEFGAPSRRKNTSGYQPKESKPFVMDQYTDTWLGVVMGRRNKSKNKLEAIVPEEQIVISEVLVPQETGYVTKNNQDFEPKWKY